MLILPVRSQYSRLRIQDNPDSRTTSSSIAISDSELHLAPKPPSQQTETMISIMPSPKSPTLKRPKLSLQTVAAVCPAGLKPKTNLFPGTETPVRTSTYANAFTPCNTSTRSINQIKETSLLACPDEQMTPPSSTSSSTTSWSSGYTSPFPVSAPYSLPIGLRSILRNSPLPRKHLLVASSRANRRMFLPVKQVVFREILEDIIPPHIIDYLTDSSDADYDENRPRAPFEKVEFRGRQSAKCIEDGTASTPVNRRRKRRREWVWRPLDDDILAVHYNSDEVDGCQGKEKVNLTSLEDIGPVELGIHLPIVSEYAYSNPTIKLGFKNDDAMTERALILQEKHVDTELELQKLNIEVLESWDEAITP